jgi:hypothetical protein
MASMDLHYVFFFSFSFSFSFSFFLVHCVYAYDLERLLFSYLFFYFLFFMSLSRVILRGFFTFGMCTTTIAAIRILQPLIIPTSPKYFGRA